MRVPPFMCLNIMTAPIGTLARNLTAIVAKASTAAWFETCAAIYDKERTLKLPGELRVNKAQRILGTIIAWCEKNGIPCRICVVKARQVGISTYAMAEGYHRCRERPTNVMVIGDEYDKSVKNLVNMFDLYAEKDTVDWGSDYKQPSKKFGNGSKMETETANDARAGASGTYQFVIATEVAHWKSGKVVTPEGVFKAFMSCVPDKPGTVVIVESTANGMGNLFHDTYTGGISFSDLQAGRIPPGWNGFIKLFYAWHEHPEYTADVSLDEATGIMCTLSKAEKKLVESYGVNAGQLKWRRAKIASNQFNGNESKFEEEYPSSDIDAFLNTGSSVFHQPSLEIMEAQAAHSKPEIGRIHIAGDYGTHCEGAFFEKTPVADAWIKIFEPPIPGCSYLVSADSMTGQATSGVADNHGILVWRSGYNDAFGQWHAPRLAARVSDFMEELTELTRRGKRLAACRWTADIMRERTAAAAHFYGGAIIAPEENADRGQIGWFLLKGIPMVSQQVHNDKDNKTETFHGWRTTEKNRRAMIEEVGRRIRYFDAIGDGVQVEDPVVIQELKAFIRLKTGRTEAATGYKDDNVLSMAIGFACLGQARVYSMPEVHRLTQMDLLRMAQQQQSGFNGTIPGFM